MTAYPNRIESEVLRSLRLEHTRQKEQQRAEERRGEYWAQREVRVFRSERAQRALEGRR